MNREFLIASSARNVPTQECDIADETDGKVGDVVLVKALGTNVKYGELELADGKCVSIEDGMEFVGVLGERKATKGTVGFVPKGVAVGDILSVLNLGGVIGKATSWAIGNPIPAKIVGFLKNKNVVNIKDCLKVEPSLTLDSCTPCVFFVGSRMDSGKSTATSTLLEVISKDVSIAGCKLTGVSCLRDTLKMKMSGAKWIADFTDVGLVSTVGDAKVVESAKGILKYLSRLKPKLIIGELGAGLVDYYNVDKILADEEIKKNCLGIVVVASDVIGASGCVEILKKQGYQVLCVMGGSTDNQAGKDLIKTHCKVPGFNYSSKEDMQNLAVIITKSL